MDLRDTYMRRGDNEPILAAALFAKDLMKGDPRTFKTGYSKENAVLSAVDIFPEVKKEDIEVLLIIV